MMELVCESLSNSSGKDQEEEKKEQFRDHGIEEENNLKTKMF